MPGMVPGYFCCPTVITVTLFTLRSALVWITHYIDVLALSHLVLLPVIRTVSRLIEECPKFVADGGSRSGWRVYLFFSNVEKLYVNYLILITLFKIYLCHFSDK